MKGKKHVKDAEKNSKNKIKRMIEMLKLTEDDE